MDRKQLEEIQELQWSENLSQMRWYSWESPIGLSIFFLTLVLIASIIKLVFFP